MIVLQRVRLGHPCRQCLQKMIGAGGFESGHLCRQFLQKMISAGFESGT
jgi:hypothetical protein